MESPDQSCALPSLASNNTSAASKVKSGGIFSGWTMCVRVKKSTDNRSFRRVLGAAGAVVVSSSDLTAYRDRLNLVLCDHESVGVLRQVLGPCTPIAHHYFLRDVLLQRVDPANIQPYIYPPNTVPICCNRPVAVSHMWQSHACGSLTYPAADMVDAARNTAWDLGKQPNNYRSNYPTQEWARRIRARDPAGLLWARDPAGFLWARDPAGLLWARDPAGILWARDPAGLLWARDPAGIQLANVVDVSNTSSQQRTSFNTPNLARRPAMLRRRNRVTTTTPIAGNTSITDYFSPFKSASKVEEIVILDDSTSKTPPSRKFEHVITLSDDDEEGHSLKKLRTSATAAPMLEVNLEDSDGDDIEVVLETNSSLRQVKKEKNAFVKSEMNDVENLKKLKLQEDGSSVNLLPLQLNSANRKVLKFDKSSNGTNSLLSDTNPELNCISHRKENFSIDDKSKVELVGPFIQSPTRQSGGDDVLSSSSSSLVKLEKLEKIKEDSKENFKQGIVITRDAGCKISSTHPSLPCAIAAPPPVPDSVPSPTCSSAAGTSVCITLTTSTSASAPPAASEMRAVKSGTPISPTGSEQGQSNGKIPHWLTMNMVGKFLENSYSNQEILNSSLNRCFPRAVDASLLQFCRVQRNTEASLYWASVNQTNLLGIDMSSKNTLSVLNGTGGKAPSTDSTHAQGNHAHGGDDDEQSNVGVQERLSAEDENDIEVVINSLLWLKLHMTPLHFPDAEMIGDMLARYVINSGVPHVQSQAMSVAQHLLALWPPCSSSRSYYRTLLRAAAATVSGKKEVPLSDVIWTLVERISEALGVPQSCDKAPTTPAGEGPPYAPRSLTFERWQYEQHLLDFLGLVFSIIDLDTNDWRSKARAAVSGGAVEEQQLIGYRLLFGFSSNPSVLPKSSMKLLQLWCSLSPSDVQPLSWRKLRLCCSRLVSLILELVWLYHTQDTQHKPDKKREDLCCGILSAEDSRFAPLATAISVQFTGMTFRKVLHLVREVPLSRHRFFLTNLLRCTHAPSLCRPLAAASGVPFSALQDLVEALIRECQNCSFSTQSQSGKSSYGTLTHPEKIRLLFMNILTYVQVNGAVFVVKKAASESLKRKRGVLHNTSDTVSSGNDSSIPRADTTQRTAQNEPTNNSLCASNHNSNSNNNSNNSNSNNSNNNNNSNSNNSSSSANGNVQRNGQVFYDGFGKVISKEYLNVCCTRFSLDRKLLTAKQSTFVRLLQSCKHIFALKLLLYLLYFKV
ncbi:hypothetical protein FHG87_016797 [Trinorchestia longiramus]|nr:hypothetical protein FHG87_016797 [Trinorchestia longiramus]